MRPSCLAAFAVGLFTFTAHADSVTITQVNPNISILPGQTLDLEFQFSAPTTNTGVVSDSGYYLNYYSSLFSYQYGPFFSFSLAPGQSVTSYIETQTAYNTDPAGLYSGTSIYVLSGNALLGTGSYAINVLPTPEPSSLVLLGTGLLGFAGMARKRFARS